MRSAKDIERSLKHADLGVETDTEADRAILGELVDMHRRSTPTGVTWSTMLRPATLGLAATIVVAFAAVFLVNRREPSEPGGVPQPAATMSAAEMLTMGQLKAAYGRGGLEELEAQCEKAAEKLDVLPISITDLIVELKGTQARKGRNDADTKK